MQQHVLGRDTNSVNLVGDYESIYFKQKCFMFSLCLSNDDSFKKKNPKPDQLDTDVLL